MAATAPFGGVCYVSLAGTQYALGGNWKVNMGGLMYTGVAGAAGVIGPTAKYGIPSIEGEIADSGGLSVQQLQQFSGTATLETATGKTYVLPAAWVSGQVALDAITGMITIKLESTSMRELTT